MAIQWNMLAAYPNAGEAFSQGWEKQQQANKQNTARSAMAALVQDPGNQRALQALAQVDPAAAQQFQQQHTEQMKAQLAQHQDSIIKGAEILRQFNPQDQQSYSAALQTAQMAGIDVSQVPQQYNPQYVQGVIHLADAFKPQANDQPGIAKDVAYYKSIGRDDLAQQLLTNHANPMVPINNGDGTVTLARPPVSGGGQSSSPPPEAVQYLRAHPDLARHFDEKYGGGASASILGSGGQTAPTPSAMFP